MQLKTAPKGVAPMPFARHALGGMAAGRPFTHVGWGATSGGLLGDGKKRIGTTPITKVEDHFVHYGSAAGSTGNGDSGGPGIILDPSGQEIAIAITSDGNATDSWDIRLDEFAEWIETTAKAWETNFPADSESPVVEDAGASDASITSPPSPSSDGGVPPNSGPSNADPSPSEPPTAAGERSGCSTVSSAPSGAWLGLVALVMLHGRRRRRA